MNKKELIRNIAAPLVWGLAALTLPAEAAYIRTVTGSNDCAGDFGNPPSCVIPAQLYPDEPAKNIPKNTPLIVKFDFDDKGAIIQTTFGNFPTIDGSEFEIDLFHDSENNVTGAGTWTYTPNHPKDPVITAYVAKGGNGYNLFSHNPALAPSDWYFTPTNPNTGKPYGLSHISFYDNGTEEIPGIPELDAAGTGSAIVLLSGLMALIDRRRGVRQVRT